MALWRRLEAAIKRLFHSVDPNPPPVTPTTPIQWSPNPNAITLEVSIHQTETLTNANGRAPERTVAVYAREALTRAGYNVDIAFNYPPVAGDYSAANGTALNRWASRSYDSDHVNLLLHAGQHRGIAYVNAKAAIAPGGEIVEQLFHTISAETDAHRNVRAALHEIGHTLGGRHVDKMIPRPHLVYQNVDEGWMDRPSPEKD